MFHISGMTTRHKRTPVKKLLEGAGFEDDKTTKSTPSSPRVSRTPGSAKSSAPKPGISKTQTPEQTVDSAVKRGRGRPPKEVG